jgi:hypothetical protein
VLARALGLVFGEVEGLRDQLSHLKWWPATCRHSCSGDLRRIVPRREQIAVRAHALRLWERASQRLLLEIGEGLWSSEKIVWGADSQVVTIGLRRYPGDAPGLVLDIYPAQQIVIPHAPAETQPLPFTELNTFLERYYAQHRQVRS